MISVAPSFSPQQSGLSQPSQSGLSQPTMSACAFFGASPTPLHFGRARPVLAAGFHKSVTGGTAKSLDAPTVGGIIDFYDNDTT